MRGSIIQRKGSSNYSVIVSYKDGTGKRKQVWEAVPGNKKDAQRRLNELLTQLDTGTFVKPGKVTVAEYLQQWLRDYCTPNLAPRTTESYLWIVRTHLIPAIGNILLAELRPQHLQHLYADTLAKGLSTRTVQYCHITLHKALSDALKLGMIARNPVDAVERPRIHRREMRVMSESDLHLFLEIARTTPYYSLFYLALFTGMRRSELLALRWSDVDLILGQISVNRTIHHLVDGQIVFASPKTDKGRRLIALSPSTVSVLRDEYKAQAGIKKALGMTIKEDDLLFCHIDGSPLLPDTISHVWIKLAKRCGLNGIRLHDARHTHASLLLKGNVHPAIVAQRLGHASVQITLDVYSHILPGLQQAAADKFDALVMGDKKLLSETVG